ncbi:MAG: transglutaminase-like domain-containing protein, partial [Gemmatimonadota bacterium]|nr:transglutaminase-like domain-containing protein [Gemmatimonadota bacterium]
MSSFGFRKTLSLLFCLVFPVSAVFAGEQGELKTFSRVITGPEAEYVIEVGGTLDPENVEITIENLGREPVESPRITVGGLYDWFDIHSMVREITGGCTTDEEKALAIWEWIHWKRFQRSPSDKSSSNPVRAMNGYGYGICGHSAVWYMALCIEAGLDARMQEIWGHTVNEVFYNGAWHFMDTNVKVFYLGRDNRTIASMAELEADPWLIERTIHPRDPWVRPEDSPRRNSEFVRYITTTKDNYVQHDYDEFIKKEYDMSYTLRPGEKLVRWWEPVLEKFEARNKRPLAPQRYANGQLVWEPDLEKIDILDCLEVIENITTGQRDGSQGPAIHVADPQDRTYTRPARFNVP